MFADGYKETAEAYKKLFSTKARRKVVFTLGTVWGMFGFGYVDQLRLVYL